MSTPGGNLLALAFGAIAPTPIPFYKFQSRTANSVGVFVATYENPVAILASVQAVPRNVYQELGLDFQKDYVMVYAIRDIKDIGRGTSGDRIAWNNSLWQLVSESDWFAMDSWTGVLAVRVGPAPLFGLQDEAGNLLTDEDGNVITDNEGF